MSLYILDSACCVTCRRFSKCLKDAQKKGLKALDDFVTRAYVRLEPPADQCYRRWAPVSDSGGFSEDYAECTHCGTPCTLIGNVWVCPKCKSDGGDG